MIPRKLKRGDEIRVVSPSSGLGFIPVEQRGIATGRMAGLGLRCSFGGAGEVLDRFGSSPAGDRVSELHDAFSDTGVAEMLTIIGGYNSNGLLARLDYDLIRDNPKVLCGYSDITALHNAIHAKTGLVTYYGPHFSTFSMKRGLDYTLEYFERCLMRKGPFDVQPADHWSDDPWYEDREERDFVPNPGYRVIREGEAEGKLLGGHLGTLLLLAGTPYMPDPEGAILLIECDFETKPEHLDRKLQSLAHQQDFGGVLGIVFGRFQRASGMEPETLEAIVETKPELADIPVVADASFGHTTPQFTWPTGGTGALRAVSGEGVRFEVRDH